MQNVRNEPVWNIIKNGFRDFIKAETSSEEGVVNLFFGILIFIVTFSSMSSGILELICSIFKPGFNIGIPWYGNVIMFASMVYYFIYCSNKLIEIKKLKIQVENCEDEE